MTGTAFAFLVTSHCTIDGTILEHVDRPNLTSAGLPHSKSIRKRTQKEKTGPASRKQVREEDCPTDSDLLANIVKET